MADSNIPVEEEGKGRSGKLKWIIGILVVILIIANVMWNMTSDKIASEAGAIRTDVAALSARVEKAENSTLDSDAVKADLEAIHSASKTFDSKLAALIKAEEAKVASLTTELENHKAYVEQLKALQAGN
ncbi:MAG: hypothetical protein LBR38_06630 [Synergistaceae bacterium]|jgi:hypothetical protein|nr:hypothetical protein [Synergistaceae bacterium]